jgi:hypothetical protein
MAMTRATFLIAAAMVITLVVAAAGIGAYMAVRRNATEPATAVADPAADADLAAALYGIDAQATAGVPISDSEIAVESTEQTVEPAAASRAARPDVETRRDEPPEAASSTRREPAPRRAAPRAAPPAPSPPAPARPEPSRPASAAEPIERPARRSVPTASPSERGPAQETNVPPKRDVPAHANNELPGIDGWRRAAPAPPTAARAREAPDGDRTRDLPPLASVSFDPPTGPTDAAPAPTVGEQLLIPADSVIGLQIDTFVTTENAEVEDDVTARVTRDVVVARRVAIPAGSLVNGSVVMVERGGKLKGASRLGVRFHTVVLDDGVEVPVATETIYREGRSRGRDNASRIGGGAVAGAILGAIFGGGRGAAIGGAAGAAGGTAAAAAGDAEPATLPAGSTLTVRLSRPSRMTVERREAAP